MLDRLIMGGISLLLIVYLFFFLADTSGEPYFAAVLFIGTLSAVLYIILMPIVTTFWFFTGAGVNTVLILMLPLEAGRYTAAICLFLFVFAASGIFLWLRRSQK